MDAPAAMTKQVVKPDNKQTIIAIAGTVLIIVGIIVIVLSTRSKSTPAKKKVSESVIAPVGPVKIKLASFTLKTANSNYLNIAGIEFLDASGNNILDASTVDTNKTQMSSLWSPEMSVANVYDGRKDTIVHTAATGDAAPTLVVALKTPAVVYSVVITNRQDCCDERLIEASILYTDDQNVSHSLGTLVPFKDTIKIPIQ